MHDTEATSVAGAARSRARVDHGRRLSDRLFSQVRPEAWLDRPIPERNRILFYLGHLEAFDWNQIGRACTGRGIDDALDRLFAFGIDPPPGELPADSAQDWPAPEQVRAYVESVRRRLDEVLDRAPQTLIDIAVEHRLMHVETLTYLLHAMPYTRRVVTPMTAPPGGLAPEHRRVEVPAGPATLGRARGSGFGWGNEFDEHTAWVEPFAVDRHKVTNGRYLEFVESGGEPPPFWVRGVNGWRWRGFDAEIPLPLDRPVYATWVQAAAFAHWAGGRLPTEAQFHRYAFGAPEGAERPHPWGDALATAERGAFDFAARDTISVLATPAGDSGFGVSQAVGNGWEWTSTPFAPFPGFAPLPSYPGYSTAFFDGEHYVLKGASCATARALLRRSFRNWFRPQYAHAYTAFRVVES
jgi:formylglycine-generating enzyme required for sulfatase activity